MFSAVLDTSVIFPATLNDTLLSFAEHGLYRPLWSEQILEELSESLVRAYPHLDPQTLYSRISFMRRGFPQAVIEEWEPLPDDITSGLPDPRDAHVIAAALHAGAPLIVTNNLRDFPGEILSASGITAVSADVFLVMLWRDDPVGGLAALRTQSARMRNPPLSVQQILERLASGLPNFSHLASEGLIA